MRRLSSAVCIFLLLTACGGDPADQPDADGHTPPTKYTIESNREVSERLNLDDQRDFELARKGLVASDPELKVVRATGTTVWDQTAYGFMEGEAPDSVNPSLWRQGQLNNIHGLFKVTDGIYQLRGFDLANMTIIEGETGWIIVDPLTVAETSARALAFARKHLGDKPIRAILFTHSHIDHFGGVFGLVTAEQVKEQGVRIIAPEHFMAEATSENVMAGDAMQRRAGFMYGRHLSRSPRAHVGTGLGKEPPRSGAVGILAPTESIVQTQQELRIDGVQFVFQHVPGSEAPAEFTFYLPEKKAFCGAELVSRNLHNLYTLRGTKIRDALKWAAYIQESMQVFSEAEVYFASHHWPIWGQEEIRKFLTTQRDTYKYIHDQSVRMLNRGATSREIAEQIQLPESLQQEFSNRGYYGTVKHNAKAVYQAYMGWYDGNPANLDPLPPRQAGEKYVEFMGGADALLERAQQSYARGEYRWVAEVVNHLVFADPDHTAARELLAAAYDQLGYQAESAPWRDVYLSAAYELRHGGPETGMEIDRMGVLREIPLDTFFDAMAANLHGPNAAGKQWKINWVFTDLGKTYVLFIENGVLHHREGLADPDADATVNLTHQFFLKLIDGKLKLKDVVFSDELDVDGSRVDLLRFLSLLDKPQPNFAIVTP